MIPVDRLTGACFHSTRRLVVEPGLRAQILHSVPIFRQLFIRALEGLLHFLPHRIVGTEVLDDPMNADDDALRVLYERIFDLTRRALAFAQAAPLRATSPCKGGGNRAAEQHHESVIMNESRHDSVQERSLHARRAKGVARMDIPRLCARWDALTWMEVRFDVRMRERARIAAQRGSVP